MSALVRQKWKRNVGLRPTLVTHRLSCPRILPKSMRSRKRVARAEAAPPGDLLRFQRLVDNGQDLFYRYRVSPLSIEYISTAALAITGRDAQEFYDDPELGLSIVHPDDRALIAGTLDAAGGSDPSKLRRTMLVRWIHRDGRIVWAEH